MSNKNNNKRLAIISIMTYYTSQIFDETKLYEFRKSPLKQEVLEQKIYVYSAKEDKAIIGYLRVSDILSGNTAEILKLTGYDKRKDGHEIVSYFGQNNPKCFALSLYDITEFSEYLTLKDMRSVSNNADMPQYLKFVYECDPLYDMIKEWDQAFSLDGEICQNPKQERQMILQRAIKKGRVK